jgi:hypothetical protein
VGTELSLRHRLRDLQVQLGVPESAEETPLFKRLMRMVPGSARNWIVS